MNRLQSISAYFMVWVVRSLALLLSGVGLFFSLWIVVPAPTYLLLPLAVGTPEVSLWLLGLNVSSLALSLRGLPPGLLQHLALGASLTALLLSAVPLVQLPTTTQHLATAMANGLGADYKARIPETVQLQMRSQPFILADAFRGIKTDEVRYTSNLQFATPEGVSLRMNIYRPPTVGHYPAIVVIYGGAWQNGNPSRNADFSRYMAARGYTVFAIDYRHAPRYRFPAQLDDVRAALQFIQQHATEYEADSDRIALVGRSAGGHLAMLAAYQSDALPVRAVVSYYGPFNLTQGYREPPKPDPLNVRAVLSAFLGGTPDEVPQQYAIASPVTYVTRPLPPTLLVHGSRDHIVQVRFAQEMYSRLHDVGSTAVLLEIPWAEHSFDELFNGLSNQIALYYTERFLAWALY